MLPQEAVVWVVLWLQGVKGWWSGADEHPALFVRGDSMRTHTDNHTIGNLTTQRKAHNNRKPYDFT